MGRGSHLQHGSNRSTPFQADGSDEPSLADVSAKVLTEQDLPQPNLLVSFLNTILAGVLVFVLSVFLYSTLYYAYMPVEMHNIPIHLQFQPCEETNDRCSFPTAKLILQRNQKLLQGQTYSISLNLEIPDSPINENHGMFMTCLNISSSSGQKIGESCKSSISQYRSPLLRTMETVTYSPTLLTGLSVQKQDIHINYFSNFQTFPLTPAEVIDVEIKSKVLQVTEASLEIHAELKGLRHLMYRHPWISSFLGVSTNILILSTILLMSWSRFLKSGDNQVDNLNEKNEEINDHQDTESVEDSVDEHEISDPVAADLNSASKSTSTPTTTPEAPSFLNRLLWFLLKIFLKFLWQSAKLVFVVIVFVMSYEAMMIGVDTNNPDILFEATKEDVIYLAKFAIQKSSILLEILRQKFLD